MTTAQEKGASSWLTALPDTEHRFTPHKSAFRDALCLRYGWLPSHTSVNCDCGLQSSVKHALSCPKGGFPSLQHKKIRDITANKLTWSAIACASSHTCHQLRKSTSTEQPPTFRMVPALTSPPMDYGVADSGEPTLTSGYSTLMPSPITIPMPHLATESMKRKKKRAYKQRIQEIEHSSLTPLVMASTGGLGPAASLTYKPLATLMAVKRGPNVLYNPELAKMLGSIDLYALVGVRIFISSFTLPFDFVFIKSLRIIRTPTGAVQVY